MSAEGEKRRAGGGAKKGRTRSANPCPAAPLPTEEQPGPNAFGSRVSSSRGALRVKNNRPQGVKGGFSNQEGMGHRQSSKGSKLLRLSQSIQYNKKFFGWRQILV